MVATHAEAADMFEGHPFIVEVGVALGLFGSNPMFFDLRIIFYYYLKLMIIR